jgi:chitin synthase
LSKPSAKSKIIGTKEDYFKLFRTRLVLAWILSNTLLVGAFTTPQISKIFNIDLNEDGINPFLSFFLWFVAGMAIFRFIGSICYKLRDRKSK